VTQVIERKKLFGGVTSSLTPFRAWVGMYVEHDGCEVRYLVHMMRWPATRDVDGALARCSAPRNTMNGVSGMGVMGSGPVEVKALVYEKLVKKKRKRTERSLYIVNSPDESQPSGPSTLATISFSSFYPSTSPDRCRRMATVARCKPPFPPPSTSSHSSLS
jgi:hypothetical protein